MARRKTSHEDAEKKFDENEEVALSKAIDPPVKTRRRRSVKFDFWTTEPGITQIKVWCMRGARNEDLSRLLHVSTGTIHQWMSKSEEFNYAVRMSKGIADAQVEFAAFKTATGYAYEEDGLAGNGDVHRLQKWQPGNPGMQKFWMMSRMPERWVDTHKIEISGDLGLREELRHLTSTDLKRLAEKGDSEDEETGK